MDQEIARLRKHKQVRAIPKKQKDKLPVATWNIANLGAQQLRSPDRTLIAEILNWFDVVAIQECRENFADLFAIHNELPKSYRVVISDASGNDERMAFLPETTRNCFTGLKGVFDYDGVVFPDLWQEGRNAKDFQTYLRYYLSDHRPMWVQPSAKPCTG